MHNNKFRLSLMAAAVLGMTGCLGGGSSKDSSTTTTTSTAEFPSGLAVASPTARSTSSPRMAARTVSANSGGGSQYAWATKKISDLLDGSAAAKDVFDASLLTRSSGNADCYGPTMAYTDHPEGSSGSDRLPSGDLGIWKESDASGTVCAAAELNQQLNGVSSHAIMGLMGLASMVSVAKAAGLTIPSAGGSLDLLSAMNDAGIDDVAFTTATLALSSDGKTWTYTLALNYTDMAKVRAISLNLSHVPGATDNEYKGMLTYRVDSDAMGGNCGLIDDATINGTLYYDRTSASNLQVNAREGGYCHNGVTGATIADADVDTTGTYLFLDPATTYDSMTKTDGWANGFSIFSAKFNPGTQEGDYVYSWQAGMGDSNARTFQMHMDADAATGEAYFGFGDAISSSDGSILGMICNWAGPGSNHTPLDYAQRQSIEFDGAKFIVGSSGSDITYAPTTTCAYEGTPSGFYYDRDQNGTADSSDKVLVYSSMAAPSGELDLDLMKKDTATSVQEAINARGFTLPPF